MTSQQTPVLVGNILDARDEFSLDEFCTICRIERHHVVEMVEEGIIETRSVTEWRFGSDALRRARISLRLRRDLGVNAAGSALVLDLLARIDSLERRLRGNS